MALEFTHPLTESEYRKIVDLPGGKVRQTLKADNPTAMCEPIV
jgi:hypothetical protein